MELKNIWDILASMFPEKVDTIYSDYDYAPSRRPSPRVGSLIGRYKEETVFASDDDEHFTFFISFITYIVRVTEPDLTGLSGDQISGRIYFLRDTQEIKIQTKRVKVVPVVTFKDFSIPENRITETTELFKHNITEQLPIYDG